MTGDDAGLDDAAEMQEDNHDEKRVACFEAMDDGGHCDEQKWVRLKPDLTWASTLHSRESRFTTSERCSVRRDESSIQSHGVDGRSSNDDIHIDAICRNPRFLFLSHVCLFSGQ